MLAFFLGISMLICLHGSAWGQQASPAGAGLTAQQKVEAVLDLLSQPDVRSLLGESLPSPAPVPQATEEERQWSNLDSWATHRRERLAQIFGAGLQLPGELSLAYGNLQREITGYGPAHFYRDVAVIFLAGVLGAWATHQLVTVRSRRTASPDARTYTGTILGQHLLPIVGQGLAVFVMFFIVQLTPSISAIVLPWIILSVAVPLIHVCTRLCVRLTVAGQEPSAIRFWSRNISAFLMFLALSWAIIRMMETLAVEKDVLIFSIYLVGAVLLLLALWAVWMRPAHPAITQRSRSFDLLISFFLIAVAGVWVAGLGVPFWLGIYAIVIPPALRCSSMLVAQLMIEGGRDDRTDLATIVTDRIVRLFIIGLAVLWLIYLVKAHPNSLPDWIALNVAFTGIAHGLLILLAADLVWAVLKTMIRRRLEKTSPLGDAHAVASSDSRLMTLLPILRNMLGILIAVVAGMMVLSELGVQVAPLMASAGIFGIALGFGSQTLVKDIISGIFYMVDDAFRVGEYIQSGSYRGTVEAFSIRSVKLRHHRGPIFTVPFGSLGAVENMSRDWSIDKFTVSVGYDTDLTLVKRLTKEIGSQIADDPEFGPFLIETVKLKGVEQFNEYGITLSFGMTVRPGGQQSVIRRRAYAMIKDAFSENGIEFASAQGPMPARIKEPPKKLDTGEGPHLEE